MRNAALILVVLLVVAILTDVDGLLKKSRRRRASARRRRRRIPIPPVPCSSCFCCSQDGIKRSVKLGGDIYPNDASLLGEKRALPPLVFPGDCDSGTLQSYAQQCGLCITEKGGKVCDGTSEVTQIPDPVEPDDTCSNIINALNSQCAS